MPAVEDYTSSYLNDPSKTLFANSTINRFSNEGENNFAVEHNCILKRISLPTYITTSVDFDSTPGDFDSTIGDFDSHGGSGSVSFGGSTDFDSTLGDFDSMIGDFDSGGSGSGGGSGSNITYLNVFELPDDVLSIRRVTWKGYKLDPLPQRNFREVFQNATQQGRPFWYVFNNVGQNLIQLFPAPNEALPLNSSSGLFDSTTGLFDSQTGLFDSVQAVNTTSGLFGENIPNCFIVEYFQAPNFTNEIIPTYFRRRLLKNYVLRGCYNIEGQGQNMKASKYFKERWRMLKELYGGLLGDLHNKPRKLVVNGISASYFFPGVPMLPIDRFGASVDAGE